MRFRDPRTVAIARRHRRFEPGFASFVRCSFFWTFRHACNFRDFIGTSAAVAEQAGRVDSGTQEREIFDSVPAVTRDQAIATVGHVFGLALTEQDKHAA